MNTGPRVARTAIMLACLLLTTFAIQAVVLPGTADARCSSGTPVSSRLLVGDPYVTESPVSGTCNKNGTYTTALRSNVSRSARRRCPRDCVPPGPRGP